MRQSISRCMGALPPEGAPSSQGEADRVALKPVHLPKPIHEVPHIRRGNAFGIVDEEAKGRWPGGELGGRPDRDRPAPRGGGVLKPRGPVSAETQTTGA